MNIGIFGAGSFGEKHINIINQIKEFKIVGFYDPNREKCLSIEKKYGIKAFRSELDLIKNCDAIDIVSSTETHYKLIKLGIKYKKHIFVEKPICCNKDEVTKLLIHNKNVKQVIQVGHIERYNPAMEFNLIDTKKITEIRAKRTGIINKRNKNNSIVLDLMIHDIDLITKLIDSQIKSIKTKKHQSNSFESVEAHIIFQNSKKAQLIADRGVNIKNYRKMSIQLSDKRIEIDFLNKTHEHWTKGIKEKVFKLDNNVNPLQNEFIEFYNNIINKQLPTVGLEAACHAVSIALQIEELSKIKELKK